MAKEFIARNGLVSKGTTTISGSLITTQPVTFSGSLDVTGSGTFTGNVGVGTNSPTYKLHISSSNNGDGLAIHYPSTNSTLFPFYLGTSIQSNYLRANSINLEFKNNGAASIIKTIGSNNNLALESATDLVFNTNGANERMRLTSAGNVGIGTTSPTSKLHVKGSGTTSSTTAFRVENSSGTPIIDAKDSLNVGIGSSALNATLNIGNNVYNGSLAVAATGSQNRVALLGNIEFVSNATGGTWAGQSIFAEGANRTFRFSAGGALNASDTEAFNFGAFVNGSRTVDYTSFRFAGGCGSNTLAADYTFVKIDGPINQTTLNQSGSVTGIYYNPSFINLTGSHTAIQTTSGDVKFQGNTNVEITGSLIGQPVDITPTTATASLDCSLGNFFDLTLSASYELYLSASNLQAGQTMNLRITQPATSGSLTYGSEFKFPGGIPYEVSASGSAVDIVSFISFDSSTLYGTAIKNLE